MKPEISIVMPGIRPDNWSKVYESIKKSTKRTFELIIVGPYQLPPELAPIKNGLTNNEYVRVEKNWGIDFRINLYLSLQLTDYCILKSICRSDFTTDLVKSNLDVKKFTPSPAIEPIATPSHGRVSVSGKNFIENAKAL